MTLTVVNSEKLNLGCGPNAPTGWLNVDGSWNAWFSHHPGLRKALEMVGLIKPGQGAQWNVRPLVHDLTRPLPFRDNTFSAIYASHVLEHLYLADAQRLLSDCERVLKPGGTIRLVVPDLRSMVEGYLKGDKASAPPASVIGSAADILNVKLGFRGPASPNGNFVLKFYALLKDFHSHKWMYDSESLVSYLDLAGFRDVAEKEFRRSAIPGIEDVEQEDRVLGGAGICVEGRKP
jgi:ubiquinone/menaquinone biosynthesis C-methylase UbiE